MSITNITCPHCGFSKDVNSSQIPAGKKTIKCPKCQQTFSLEANPKHGDEMGFEIDDTTPPQPAAVPSAASASTRFCRTCGEEIHIKAEICPHCGVRGAGSGKQANKVSKVALLLLTIFLGGLGAHKFYTKKYLAGALYLLFFWTLIPGLIAFIEFIIYATKSEEELQRQFPEAGGGGVIVLAIIVPFVMIAIIGILAAIAIPQFAAYRERGYSAIARSDLQNCKVEAEAFFADNGSYPLQSGQFACPASNGVALYYLAISPENYQLISYHTVSQTAFLVDAENSEISKNMRGEIENQLVDTFGQEQTGAGFHFIE